MQALIIAKGKFPEHPTPLAAIHKARTIVCCDGAVDNLMELSIEPTAIVGDLDSLAKETRVRYADRLYHNPNQQTNDLTKSIYWCLERGFKVITILAATGLREDHTLGNIGLLPSYARRGADITMLTDHGSMVPLLSSKKFDSYKGQVVSIFPMAGMARITTRNLEFPLNNEIINELWMGTLNRSLGDWFELEINEGELVVFRGY